MIKIAKKDKNVVNDATEEDDEVSNYSDFQNDETNKISADLVANFFYLQGRKMMRDAFTQVYDDLLSKIERDYGIPEGELREKYPLDVQVHRRKPRDPELACIALTKKGNPCTNKRKPNSDLCGIHLQASENGKVETQDSVPSIKAKASYEPKPDPTPNKQKTYIPKEETPKSTKKKSVAVTETENNLSDNRDKEEPKTSIKNDSDDEEAEGELEIIDGTQYVVLGNKIYNMPEDTIDEITLDELVLAGTKQENGTIKWN